MKFRNKIYPAFLFPFSIYKCEITVCLEPESCSEISKYEMTVCLEHDCYTKINNCKLIVSLEPEGFS